ncbi:MAG: hypothetical protein QXV81_08875 [Ignisphaera sp.]
MSVCSPADEVRRLLIVFRRKLFGAKAEEHRMYRMYRYGDRYHS